MNKIFNKILNIILVASLTMGFSFLSINSSQAQDEKAQAQQFAQAMLKDIYDFLPKHKSNKEIYPYFEKLTEEKFDVDYLAMWSIGQYGKKMDNNLKQEYLLVARRYMVLSYGSVFKKYYEEYKYKITGTDILDENSYGVKFFIEPKKMGRKQDNVISAYWKIVKKDDFKVADIVVNGVSLANAQRFEFEAQIKKQDGNLALFIKDLDAQVLKEEKALGLR